MDDGHCVSQHVTDQLQQVERRMFVSGDGPLGIEQRLNAD